VVLANEVLEESDYERLMLIFGRSNKMFSFDPFLKLLGDFREKLSTARMYVLIGYSFNDSYINDLLIQQLNAQSGKMMVV